MEQVNKKYHQIVINFGDQEVQIAGTTKITKRDIFVGSTKTENALLFVENLEKVVKTKQIEPSQQMLNSNKLEALQSESRSIATGTTSNGISAGKNILAAD